MPEDRQCNLIYAWCLERIKPEKQEEWKMQLNEPLPWDSGVPTGPEMWDDEAEAAAWASATAAIGG